ncbi:MAG: hypothetical protein RW306_15870 [Geobacteraceae bacterium]|nr:hypothetical protein [Geobacteraceae bacterium]
MKELKGTARWQSYLGIKAFQKNLKRKRLKAAKKSENSTNVYKSEALDSFVNHLINVPKIEKNKTLELIMPENFSLIENPAKSLLILNQLATVYRKNKIKNIVFHHENLSNIDLSAEVVLGFLAKEIRKEERLKVKKTHAEGYYPADVESVRLIKTVGVIENLGVTHENVDKDEISKMRLFKERSKGKGQLVNLTSSDHKEKTVYNFVEHIDQCLGDHDRQLTLKAKQSLCDYMGEILTNAEDHSGWNNWNIVGYLDNNKDDHMCEITIYNFGKTIAETLMEIPETSYTHAEITPYIEAHAKKQFFKKSWQKSDLLTLVALQGHISSKNITKQDDRGQGTVDLIGFFQKIHSECSSKSKSSAKMAILSGSTHIYFDGKYKMSPDKTGRKVIAFNSENLLDEKPDEEYVTNLGELFFPGTIIAIKFPMEISRQTEEVTQ